MINFYNGQHAYYCGVDLHKKTMYVYIINHDGETVFHKNLRTRPDEFLNAIAPFLEGLIVAVECIFVADVPSALVLASRPLPAGRHRLHPRARALHEGRPWH